MFQVLLTSLNLVTAIGINYPTESMQKTSDDNLTEALINYSDEERNKNLPPKKRNKRYICSCC